MGVAVPETETGATGGVAGTGGAGRASDRRVVVGRPVAAAARVAGVLALSATLAAAGAAGDEEHFVAAATSPPSSWSFDAAEEGHYGFGWHRESAHDAGREAEAECARQGGAECTYTAAGQSMRGGCVGLALASWRDEGESRERAYVTASSSFRNLIARQLRSACSVSVFGGKRREAVAEHGCEVVRVLCAEDIGAAPQAAAETGRRDAVDERRDAAASPSRCGEWNTAGFFASATGASVQRCLDAGFDANARDEEGWTPLRFAAQLGSPDAVRVLLEASAELGAQDKHGGTPLFGAVFNSRATTVRALLDAGADVNGPDAPLVQAASGVVLPPGSYPLFEQTQVTVDIVEALLARGADPTRAADGDRRALVEAVSAGTANAYTVRIVRMLLAAGANPDSAGRRTPLTAVACRLDALPNEYDVLVVEALLEAGADPNGRLDNGWTTLYCAVPRLSERFRSMGNIHMVRILEALLDAGADPSASSSDDYPSLPIDNLVSRDSALWGTDVHRRLERAASEARGRRAPAASER